MSVTRRGLVAVAGGVPGHGTDDHMTCTPVSCLSGSHLSGDQTGLGERSTGFELLSVVEHLVPHRLFPMLFGHLHSSAAVTNMLCPRQGCSQAVPYVTLALSDESKNLHRLSAFLLRARSSSAKQADYTCPQIALSDPVAFISAHCGGGIPVWKGP